MTLDDAIDVLVVEVDKLSTPLPKEDTREWWLLRARSTGLSLLRTIKKQGLTPIQAEAFRKGFRAQLMEPTDTEALDPDKTLPPNATQEI